MKGSVHLLGPPGVAIFDHEPWATFREAIEDSGFDVTTTYGPENVPEADALVAFFDSPSVRRLCRRGFGRLRSAQVILEPPATAPLTYSRYHKSPFGFRFAASHRWARMIDGEAFTWPQRIRGEWRDANLDLPSKRAVFVGANKFSAARDCNYRLRRQVVNLLAESPDQCAVVGAGWTSSGGRQLVHGLRALAKSARFLAPLSLRQSLTVHGHFPESEWILDPTDFYRSARVVVVIENSNDYVSEKLFECLRIGVAPVYVGPDLEEFGLPHEVAIESPPDIVAIRSLLEKVSPEMACGVVQAGQRWLHSDAAQAHDGERITRALAHRVMKALYVGV